MVGAILSLLLMRVICHLPDRYGWRYSKVCRGEFGLENNGEAPNGLGTGLFRDVAIVVGVAEGEVLETDVTRGLESEIITMSNQSEI